MLQAVQKRTLSLITLQTLLKRCRLPFNQFMFSKLACGLKYRFVCLFLSLQIGRNFAECNGHVKVITLL